MEGTVIGKMKETHEPMGVPLPPYPLNGCAKCLNIKNVPLAPITNPR